MFGSASLSKIRSQEESSEAEDEELHFMRQISAGYACFEGLKPDERELEAAVVNEKKRRLMDEIS